MPIASLDPVIPAIKRLVAYDLDRTATGIGSRSERLGSHVQFSRQLQQIFLFTSALGPVLQYTQPHTQCIGGSLPAGKTVEA